jgi:ParB family chromosome partitioning protein
MARKTGLGRGLDALIPGSERPAAQFEASGGVKDIPVDRILPNPRQPRARFDPTELAELASSIREHGIIQPLIVTQSEGGDQYILIAGERRLLAARQAGLTHVPAISRQASDQQRLELALIENVQRADLSPLEAAEAYRQLSQDFGLSQEAIAERVGKSRAAVANTLRLLKLSSPVREALTNGAISEGHGRALLYVEEEEAQERALQVVLEGELTVRQTENLGREVARHGASLLELAPRVRAALGDGLISGEHALALLGLQSHAAQENALQTILAKQLNPEQSRLLVQRLQGDKGEKAGKPRTLSLPAEISELGERLELELGFPVKLKYDREKKSGSITIQYYNDADLDAIVNRILGEG